MFYIVMYYIPSTRRYHDDERKIGLGVLTRFTQFQPLFLQINGLLLCYYLSIAIYGEHFASSERFTDLSHVWHSRVYPS
jgi:hypothetical protein